ncbi:hypothetical protein [Pseudoclavibacter terrae]|uniref:hypothetical protein n=1 Tax=Pseudoclavibacter terrae TaxID=1530195 RepID=UPI00232E9C96|nr:hypothetical protein [Pseudoclavibacter terrae]
MTGLVILSAALLFAACMFWSFSRIGRPGRPRIGGALSGAMTGVDQAFAPTHAEAAETLDAERVMPAPTPVAGGPLPVETGHVEITLGRRDEA